LNKVVVAEQPPAGKAIFVGVMGEIPDDNGFVYSQLIDLEKEKEKWKKNE